MRGDFLDLIVNAGIYGKVHISKEDVVDICDLFTTNYSIDLYCDKCKSQSVFVKEELDKTLQTSILSSKQRYENAVSEKVVYAVDNTDMMYQSFRLTIGITRLSFVCSRQNHQRISVFILMTSDSLIKVGQYPSPIDVAPKISKQYSTLLGEYFGEYKKAMELNTHGYHVGAYAYLRRIVENLIEKAHQDAIGNQEGWDEETYKSERVVERIKSLKNYLPDFFVTNVPVYGLISKGIHELSEEECEDMFPVLRAAIDYTLDELIEKRQKELKKQETSSAISKLASKHGNKVAE